MPFSSLRFYFWLFNRIILYALYLTTIIRIKQNRCQKIFICILVYKIKSPKIIGFQPFRCKNRCNKLGHIGKKVTLTVKQKISFISYGKSNLTKTDYHI